VADFCAISGTILYQTAAVFGTSKQPNLVPVAADDCAIKRPNFVLEGGRFLYKQAADVWAINQPNFVPESGRI